MSSDERLYSDLAAWWPLISQPAEYADEAAQYKRLLDRACSPVDVLELGSGGGHTASHMAPPYRMTLVDRSASMLEQSRRLNPTCEHVESDLCGLRLGREFDAVFLHDAAMYLLGDQLAAAIETAFVHCRPGGAALFVPDCFAETFEPGTDSGGSDAGERGARYLEWTTDVDPSNGCAEVHYAFLLRDGADVRLVEDHHRIGIHPRVAWLDACRTTGFVPELHRVPIDEGDRDELEVILARRPS